MKNLADYKDNIHSCSKCGLCQSVCPVYKITGNDCTVSRGLFIMLKSVINGDLKMSKTINKYLDICLKCNACSDFCPSEIDVVDIISLAKAEYFKLHKFEKFVSFIQKNLIKIVIFINSITSRNIKSKIFDKKVVYFGGCNSNKTTKASVIKLLNACEIEVITPNFDCCGLPFFIRGDIQEFNKYIEKFFKILNNNGITEIVTSCASCEKMLKSYKKWGEYPEYSIKNIYQYIRENELKLSLKNKNSVTFHKPCNLSDFQPIEWILENTENLEYIPAENYDKCCGFAGLFNPKEFKTMSKIFKNKQKDLLKTGAKTVLTSCLACETTLKLFSFGKYKVQDFSEFLAKNLK